MELGSRGYSTGASRDASLTIIHRGHGFTLADPVWADPISVYVLVLLAAAPLVILISKRINDERVLGWLALSVAVLGALAILAAQIRRGLQRRECNLLFAQAPRPKGGAPRISCDGMSLPVYRLAFTDLPSTVPHCMVVFIDSKLLRILGPLLVVTLAVSGLITGSFRTAVNTPWLMPIFFIVCWAPFLSAVAYRRRYMLENGRITVTRWWLGFWQERREIIMDLRECSIVCRIPRDIIEVADKVRCIRIHLSSLTRPHGLMTLLVREATTMIKVDSADGPDAQTAR